MTASRVLRDRGGFSESTREKVLAHVEQLGYLPNRLGPVLAGGHQSTFVGVSIPGLGSEIFAQVLEGIDRKLNAFGHQTVLGITDHAPEAEEQWIETVLSWQPAGLILTGHRHTERAVALLRASGLPVAEIWDLAATSLDLNIGLDHLASGREMGRLLTGRGYRRLAFLGTCQDTADAARQRLAGFAQGVEEGGGTLVRQHLVNDDAGFYPGFYGTEQLLAAGLGIEAIFFQNDNMAVGGLQYCRNAGISVPGDLGLAGWGDLAVTAILPQRLTTIKVFPLKLGQTVVERLMHRIQGVETAPRTDVGFRLIEGATV